MHGRPSNRCSIVAVAAFSFIAAGCYPQHTDDSLQIDPMPVMQAGELMPEAPQRSAAWPEPEAVGPLSDGDIVAMLLMSQNLDIANAELATDRGQGTDIKPFAAYMAADAQGIADLLQVLVQEKDMTFQDNSLSLAMRDEATETRERLTSLQGAAFDSAYFANEVAFQKHVLESIDYVFLPHASTKEVRSLLESIRPGVAAHVKHAQEIAASLKSNQ